MASVKILLYQDQSTTIQLEGDQPATGADITVSKLTSTAFSGESFGVSGSVVVPFALLTAGATAGVFQFAPGAGPKSLTPAKLTLAAGTTFFGKAFAATADFSLSLTISLPGAQPATAPFAVIACSGEIQLTSTVATTVRVGFKVIIDAVPTAFPVSIIPALEIDPPDVLGVSPVRIPWSFPALPDFPIHIPASAFTLLAIPVRVGWKSIVIDVNVGTTTAELTVTVNTLSLTSTQGLGSVQADVNATFPGAGAAPSVSVTNISASGAKLPDLSDVTYLDSTTGCALLGWTGAPLAPLLGLVSSELADDQDPSKNEFVLRFGIATTAAQEIRLDWLGTVVALPRTLGLPGFDVALPQLEMASLVAYPSSAGGARRLAMVATIPAGQTVTASSTFTWSPSDSSGPGTDPDRELHRAANGQPSDPPLVTVSSTTAKGVSVVLADLAVGGGPPAFFRQLSTPLVPLSTTPLGGGADPCTPSKMTIGPLTADTWSTPTFAFNIPASPGFQFPLLYQSDAAAPGLGQSMSITKIDAPPTGGAFATTFEVTLHIQIQVGDNIKLDAQATLDFDLETFSFKVDHDAGITFVFDTNAAQTGQFLGLNWSFTPAQTSLGTNNDQFPAFILVTKGADYQLKQAPGSSISVSYDRATSPHEPIVFAVTNFVLMPSGIDLDATVTAEPARLNGLETRFSFTDGKFQIRSNRITDFSLAGSGSLPPALVGNATADIALQFGERNGSLKLLAGSAELHATKLLRCEATRFEFEIDSLELKFVDDGGYHLYFTLSGSARYAPLASDDPSGPLAWLPAIQIHLIDCPLTGNMTVIAKHIKFLIELPKKVSFSLLGCFEMELRGISFLAQTQGLFGDNPAAMQICGQVKFAEDGGDVIDAQIDFHNLYVALPAPGSILPRLHLKGLDIKIQSGDAFSLEGGVDFLDNDQIAPGLTASGFEGKGSVTIIGLPTLSATFAFLRVSPDSGVTWLKAWFLYLEVDRISIQIPVVEVFIREVGLGFGYRFTLASIKTADQINDPKALIQALTQLSLTQGNLSDVSSWKVDVEGPGESARWTVALRAMISETSASAGITDYNQDEEADLACLFLLDAVLALRSDLTFFMVARAWLDTNYNDFVIDNNGVRENPLFSAFILLSARKKMLLANMASNQNAAFGGHPPLPGFLEDAIRDSRFSATLLVQPGLFHAELGWPNMLEWSDTIGPLSADFRGGTIFRVSSREFVNGLSFFARGTLQLSASVDLGLVGGSLEATATVAYGARYIGVLAFVDPLNNSAFYAGVGIEINVAVAVSFWIKIPLLFATIELDFSFSFAVNFTASLEVGITFRASLPVGARGSATIGISVMGHDLHFGVRIGLNEDAVKDALAITNPFLNVGLTADDGAAEQLPGTPGAVPAMTSAARPRAITGVVHLQTHALATHSLAGPAPAAGGPPSASAHAGAAAGTFLGIAPPYHINSVASGTPEFVYMLLFPAGQIDDGSGTLITQNGFYAVPPDAATTATSDYSWTIPAPPAGQAVTFEHFDPLAVDPVTGNRGTWKASTPTGSAALSWQVDWAYSISYSTVAQSQFDASKPTSGQVVKGSTAFNLRRFLQSAYVTQEDVTPPTAAATDQFPEVHPIDDPTLPEIGPQQSDARVQHPDDSAYEAAVLGAATQATSSPYFRRDPNSEYEKKLSAACLNTSSIYSDNGQIDTSKTNDPNTILALGRQRAKQLRGAVLQAIVRDFQRYAALAADTKTNQAALTDLETNSLAFRLGVVCRASGPGRSWLVQNGAGTNTIVQRLTPTSTSPDSRPQTVEAFNIPATGFAVRPPQFTQVKQFAHANSVAFAWTLVASDLPTGASSASFRQGDRRLDPEHLLAYYKVHRVRLDGNEAPADFTLKKADMLHRPTDAPGQLVRLLSRFQFVDHFANEVASDSDALTAVGKTYLYTITPVDVGGQESTHPLSLVVTRYPSEPPQVPTDGELVIAYEVDKIPPPGAVPVLHEPVAVVFRWTTPAQPSGQAPVGIKRYQLVFRREATVPVGYFGSDAGTQGSVAAGLPTSNARPLRTDIVVLLDTTRTPPSTVVDPSTGRNVNALAIGTDVLEHDGILPAANGASGRPWRPESWRVFAQSVSVAEVPSALAPVGLVYRFLPASAPGLPGPGGTGGNPILLASWPPQQSAYEERRPAQLEWLPDPVGLGPLPPRDVAGDPGFLQVPMPDPSQNPIGLLQPVVSSSVAGLIFNTSPDRRRAVRLLWNQGPSHDPSHPIDLHAHYQVYEFDADAHTGESLDVPAGTTTVPFSQWACAAGLRLVQDVELLAPDQLPLTPPDLNAPITWEAWYPSVSRRLAIREQMITQGAWPPSSESPYSPWYSWRDSYITWPDPGQGAGLSVTFPDATTAPVAPLGDPPTLELAYVNYKVDPVSLALIATPLARKITLTSAKNNLNGVRDAINAAGLPVTANVVSGTVNGATVWLLSVGPAPTATPPLPTSFELRTTPGDPTTSLLTREMLVDLNVPWSPKPISRRTRPCHPFLQRVVTLLGQSVATGAAAVVELNPPPVRVDDDHSLDNLLSGTSRQSDPYGWGILRRFGLAVAFRLREADGSYVEADDLFTRVESAVTQALDQIDPKRTLAPFVHVDHLFQAGRRYRLARHEGDPPTDSPLYQNLLALVMVSLRPTIQQRFNYQRVVIPRSALPAPDPSAGAAAVANVTINVNNAKGASYKLRVGNDNTGSSDGSQSQNSTADSSLATGSTVQLTIPFPPTGSGSSQQAGDAIVLLFRAIDFQNMIVTLNTNGSTTNLTFAAFTPTDWDSTYFEAPDESYLINPPPGTDPPTTNATDLDNPFWIPLGKYIAGIRPVNAPNATSSMGIVWPPNDPNADRTSDVLNWVARFFDYGGDVVPAAAGSKASTAAGPFLASAYPRAATPLAITPDPANRIETYEPINDLWAHIYRYYVKPIGRYDPLWDSLAGSPILFPTNINTGKSDRPGNLLLLDTIPSPDSGGLDVVFDRIRPLAAPLVLASRRLDSPVPPGQVAPPGKVWEVLTAKHPEQTLVERNRSLADHLSFRQTAHSLRRQFTYVTAAGFLQGIVKASYSPLYDAPDTPVAPTASPILWLVVGTSTAMLDLTNHNTVAGVVSAINAAGLPVTATQETTVGLRLRVDLKSPLTDVELRATTGDAGSDLLFHPQGGGGPDYGPVSLVPPPPFVPSTPTNLELYAIATVALDLTGNNTVAGAATAINAAGLRLTATVEPRQLVFQLVPTTAGTLVQLRTKPGDTTTDILSHPSGQPSQSPVFAGADTPVATSAPPVLELVVGNKTTVLNLAANTNNVAGTVAAINASGLAATATALSPAASRLRIDPTAPVQSVQLRSIPGKASSDLLTHPAPTGTANGPDVPTGDPVVTSSPPVVELVAIASSTITVTSAQNTIAGVASLVTGAGITGVSASAEEYGLQFQVALTTAPLVDVELRTTAGDATTNVLSQVFDLGPLAAPVTATFPGLPTALNSPDVLSAADLADSDPAAPANLPARVERFAQGVVSLQFKALPFYYTHRLLLVAQAAEVVSPVTELRQTDFYFVSPPAIATMEAVPSACGLPRRRRVLVTLARFWDGLDAEGQQRWSVEDPQSSSGSQRYFGLMPDPEVDYQIVVAHPSGLVESLAQIRSQVSDLGAASGNPPAPKNPSGYQVLQVPKTFLVTPVRVLPPADVADAGRQTMQLELLVDQVAGSNDDAAITTQPISSRAAFASASANDRVSFPPPSALALSIVSPLSTSDVAELQGLQFISPGVARDQSFRNAIGVLTQALASGAAVAQTVASVGLEALGEISTTVFLPTEANRKIVWAGLMSQEQHDAIAAWADTSSFRMTFLALLKAVDATVITLTFSAPITKPTDADLPASLRPAMNVSTTQLTWTELLMTDAQTTDLQSLEQDTTLPQPFRDAIGLLLAEATTPTAASTVTVTVVEAEWHVRPTVKDLTPSLASKILIGVGQIAFRGLMTRAEGRALKGTAGLSVPDQSAIDDLFIDSLNSGLNGGTLTIRTRRGGAPGESAPIQATL